MILDVVDVLPGIVAKRVHAIHLDSSRDSSLVRENGGFGQDGTGWTLVGRVHWLTRPTRLPSIGVIGSLSALLDHVDHICRHHQLGLDSRFEGGV